MSNLNTHYVSGEQGTTGREPFEEPTRSLTGNQGAGVGVGQGVGHEHHHHGHHGHHHGQGQSGLGSAGLKDEGSGGIPHSQAPATSGQHIGNAAGPAIGTAGTGTGAGFTSASGHEHSELAGRSGVTSGFGTGEGKGNESTTVGLATGTGAAQPVGGERTHAEVPGPGSTKPSGEGYGGIGASETGSHVDRVGPQGQGQAAYERTGAGGPITGGAAGTDRFDTGSSGAAHGSAEGQDTSQRAPGKGTGGIGGVLGTSDKDFTGRERTGGALGAYADSEGPFESNTSGPKGHTALTGREGNLDNNPVAQAKSRGDGTGSTASTHDSTSGEKEHKGFIEKVKDAITK